LAEELEIILKQPGDWDPELAIKEPGEEKGLACQGRRLPLGQRTLIMGILNLTPDSFSDGARFNLPEAALARARQLVEEGADILDVGAESTRPGFEPVSAEEEWKRLEEVLPQLLEEIAIPISLDTYKASVARKALDLGIGMINDIWGLRGDPEMAGVIKEYGVPVVAMHNREKAEYQDLMAEVLQDLGKSLVIADRAGIDQSKIILDPGIGFGKTLEHNLEIMQRLSEIRSLGRPLLLGTSRKSLIGKVLDASVDQRLEGTTATVVLGIAGGVEIVRVHDVRGVLPAVRMADAIVRFPGARAKE
jgi:dihydropteroate synthase